MKRAKRGEIGKKMFTMNTFEKHKYMYISRNSLIV